MRPAVELVVRLSGALQRQDLALDEEQGLLEELLATGTDQSSGTPPGPLGSFVSSEDGPGALLLALGEKEWTLLVSYTFERRYGWSESTDSNDDRAMESLDNRAKKKINETLEQILNAQLLDWLKEHPLWRPIFQAFVAVAPASQKPVVRQRCYLHLLDWIKRQANSDNFEVRLCELEDLIQKALISALTDVWSATRKACAQRFKAMGQLLTLQQQEGIVQTLLDAWQDSGDAWKAKEGILLGLTAVIAQFSQIDVKQVDSVKDAEAPVNVRMRFGADKFDALPSFITQHLKPLLFGALAHPQLSVRENAAKAFSCYLCRTPLDETEVCLAQVIRTLRGRHTHLQKPSTQFPGAEHSSATAATNKVGEGQSGAEIVVVEAFEGQGLLSLASDLLERLPSRLIIQQWHSLITTFTLYLSHSASTVRQACSSLFVKLMAKSDDGAASLQRLVLQGLSTTWVNPRPAQAEEEADSAGQTWQGREGRLLAYELVLGFLVEDHTLKTFKSDPKAIQMVGASPCSPKKMSNDVGEYMHHRPDRSLNDRLEREGSKAEAELTKRAPSPEVLSKTSSAGNGDYSFSQTNMSPYSASWLQSPSPLIVSQSLSNDLPAPASTSSISIDRSLRSNPGMRARPSTSSPRQSPTSRSPCAGSKESTSTNTCAARAILDADESVLDKFRRTDDCGGVCICSDGTSSSARDARGHDDDTGEEQSNVTVTFEPLRVVLDRMFEEVLHSIGHVRWELRRMGLQVLPLLCTTALWYEMSLLQDIWQRWLLLPHRDSGTNHPSKDPPYSYAGVLALREIVKKVLEYCDFVRSAPGSVLPAHTVRRVRVACNWLEDLLPGLLPAVDALLESNSKHALRVGAVAVDVLMHVHCRFPHAAAARQRKEVVLLTEWLTSLYASAHRHDGQPHLSPDNANDSTTKSKLGSPDRAHSVPALSGSTALAANATGGVGRAGSSRSSPLTNSPNDARSRQGRRTAENVERALLTDIAPLLPGFVAACDLAQMLYMTPLLVITLAHYPEELSIQLQLVEAMHRIIHLPLTCWTDVLTSEEGVDQGDQVYADVDDRTQLRRQIQAQGTFEGTGVASESTGNSWERKRPPSLPVGGATRDPPRKYASCCTPLRRQRRYCYFRPQVMMASNETGLLMPADNGGSIHAAHAQNSSSAPSSVRNQSGEGIEYSYRHTGGERVEVNNAAEEEDAASANARPFEDICTVIVDGLLPIVQLQNTEIVLFRAVLAVLYSVCCVIGDARFLPAILQSLSTRLRTGKSHHSPAGELQRLQLRSNCIKDNKSNDLRSDASESDLAEVSRAASVPSVASTSSSSRCTPQRCASSTSGASASTTSIKVHGQGSQLCLGSGAQGDGMDDSEDVVTAEASFSSSLAQRRSSQALAETVSVLTIDTGTDQSRRAVGEGEREGEGKREEEEEEEEEEGEEEEEEEESSDWDESDDWSDEEDLAAFEIEVASFLTAVEHQSRQWTGSVSTPEHRLLVRGFLHVKHQPKYLRRLDEQIREMPVGVQTMVQRLFRSD